MDAFWACVELAVARRSLSDSLAFARDYDARRTIRVPGVGEHVSVDFWAPVMAAHLEALGRLDDCETERDILVRLIACLIVSDFEDFTKCPQLGARALELAIQGRDAACCVAGRCGAELAARGGRRLGAPTCAPIRADRTPFSCAGIASLSGDC
jgi:hypothetical protein